MPQNDERCGDNFAVFHFYIRKRLKRNAFSSFRFYKSALKIKSRSCSSESDRGLSAIRSIFTAFFVFTSLTGQEDSCLRPLDTLAPTFPRRTTPLGAECNSYMVRMVGCHNSIGFSVQLHALVGDDS